MSIQDFISDVVVSRVPAPAIAPRTYLGDPLAAGPCGRRFVRPLYLPIRGTEFSFREILILWWRDGSREDLTRECREIGVSAALSWLASHCERMNADWLIGCEILYQRVPLAMLPPGEKFTPDLQPARGMSEP